MAVVFLCHPVPIAIGIIEGVMVSIVEPYHPERSRRVIGSQTLSWSATARRR